MKIKLTQTIKEVRNIKGYNTTETVVKIIDYKQYENYVNSVCFYKSLGGKEKIKVKDGKVTKLISISLDRETKIIRNFQFI